MPSNTTTEVPADAVMTAILAAGGLLGAIGLMFLLVWIGRSVCCPFDGRRGGPEEHLLRGGCR
jgi:hypothetical protein